jgi:sugar phosphate isomerase/epimerase
MQFGISTHLYHEQRLTREHLAGIAAAGFEAVEVFATRSHVDYHDEATIAQLEGWLRDTGLRLHGIHAPITDRLGANDTWGEVISNAAADNGRRQAAVRETDLALNIARRIETNVLVVHLGVPDAQEGENSRAAALRSIDEICRLAEPIGIQVAIEVIPNALSDPASLVRVIERDLEGTGAGICLDFGHAFLLGGVPDAIEVAGEHIITTHVHDNGGRRDDHLVPFRGRIDWDASLLSMQKIGYDGTYVMEVAGAGDPAAVLEDTRHARQRVERILSAV